jgi:hypothetical protein
MSRSSDVNPYQAPMSGSLQAAGPPENSAELGSAVTSRTVEFLRQTQPWVRFLSILAFIWFAGMIVVTIILLARAAASEELASAIMAAVYGIYALLALPPAVFLGRYASGIARFRASSEPYDLESAIRAQKSYWRFAGIAMLIVLAFCVLSMIVFALGTGFGRDHSRLVR